MSIEKHTTKCLVIEGYEHGEHDKVFKLFTRDYGVIMAKAVSVRKIESKMRAHLLPRRSCVITLVQGREIWRIVGVQDSVELPPLVHDVTHLVKRFMRGEGGHKALFDRLEAVLQKSDSLDVRNAKLLVYYIVLVDLGYADAKVIGVASIEEYVSYGVEDLYTHLVLSYDAVRKHVYEVLKEVQL